MRTREWKRKNDRWMFKETETMKSGNTFTNFFMQATTSENTEEGKTEGFFQSSNENEWNQADN